MLKGGIYCFLNTVDGKQYIGIGSAKDFYIRLYEHLKNKKSNINLPFNKYGLDKFHWVVYDRREAPKIISDKDLTNLETSYIKAFNYTTLYNFKLEATSSLGYKHTIEAITKERYKNKNNHPMYGKSHSEKALALIRCGAYEVSPPPR